MTTAAAKVLLLAQTAIVTRGNTIDHALASTIPWIHGANLAFFKNGDHT
jgi:hypothetical protein